MNNWQYELAEAKKIGKDDDLIPVNQPLWATQLPLVDRLRADVDHLLQQLPIMRTVKNVSARETYRDQLAKAFIRMAYLEARAIQLSDKLTVAERQERINTIFQNCTQRIEEISSWLSL